MRHVWLTLASAAIACGPPPPSGLPLEVVPCEYLTSMRMVDLMDGDPVSLEFPPQGGHVLFIGARARNLDDSVATLRARLRSVADNSIFAEEARTVTFDPSPDDPALKIPDLRTYSNVSNVPVCPSYSAVDLYDHPFTLEVIITESRTGREGSATRTVKPSCKQTDAAALRACKCECEANYVLGKCS